MNAGENLEVFFLVVDRGQVGANQGEKLDSSRVSYDSVSPDSLLFKDLLFST
jgi:hypothetical protein